MKIQIILLSMFLLLNKNSEPQQLKVSQIEFATSTRGYHKNVIITKDMLIITQQSHNDVSEHTTEVKMVEDDWSALLGALKDLSLEEISTLASPTMRRASDAARSSTLSITDENGKLYSHSFDNENPNAKLKRLMECIVALEERITNAK